MLLYTVHGKEGGNDRRSVAVESGLSDYLGYVPMFCSLVNRDSLTDTWFRVYSASPSFVEVIDVYEVDDVEASPMDVVDWCNLCLREQYPSDSRPFELMMNGHHPESTDYLLNPKAAVRRQWRFDVLDLINCSVDGIEGDEQLKKALALSMRKLRAAPSKMSSFYESVSGRDALSGQLTMETWYRLVTLSGAIPFIWSTVTGNDISPRLVDIDVADLGKTGGLQKAQLLLAEWDNTLGENDEFSHAQFQAMRSFFIDGCDQLAHSIADGVASKLRMGRNDECFCGSGKKYKKCCSRKSLDELSRM